MPQIFLVFLIGPFAIIFMLWYLYGRSGAPNGPEPQGFPVEPIEGHAATEDLESDIIR